MFDPAGRGFDTDGAARHRRIAFDRQRDRRVDEQHGVGGIDPQGARLVGFGDQRGGSFGLSAQPVGLDRRRLDDLADEPLDRFGDQLRQFLARFVLQRFGGGDHREQLLAFDRKGGFGEALAFGKPARKGIVGGLGRRFGDRRQRSAARLAELQRAKAAVARHRMRQRGNGRFGREIRHNRRPRPRA